MKKTMFVLALVAACLMILSGCSKSDPAATPTVGPTASAVPSPAETGSHEHSWQDATCSAPKTCAECGLTEGDPLEHTFGDWYPDQNKQYRTCGVCDYRETAALNLEDYHELAVENLSTTWYCISVPESFTGLSEHTMNDLTLSFSGQESSVRFENETIYTFEWELVSVTPWSGDDSSKGIILDFVTAVDGSQLVLDGQEITILALSLSIPVDGLEEGSQPALNMLASIAGKERYIGFIPEYDPSDPEINAAHQDAVQSSLSGTWYSEYDPTGDLPISSNTLSGLSLTFDDSTGTLSYENNPIYSFDWELDYIVPWGNDPSGFSAIMLVHSSGDLLVLDDKEIIITGYELNIGSEEEGVLPVLSLLVSIDGNSYFLFFNRS